MTLLQVDFAKLFPMSEMKLVHRPHPSNSRAPDPSLLVWQTCRRQIFFLDGYEQLKNPLCDDDQLFSGPQAEAFLIEVLCGLKSSLLGETEVFGQFKSWWQALPECSWKKKQSSQIQNIFNVVKHTRQEFLCGFGAQSYGSLLRKILPNSENLDIVGAGHLATEILPWLRGPRSVRIWCRDPQKVRNNFPKEEVLSLMSTEALHNNLVIAAPLGPEELSRFLIQRKFSGSLYDLRHNSEEWNYTAALRKRVTLNELTALSENHRRELEQRAEAARLFILSWQRQQETRIQVRPFGWEDL